MVYITTEDNPWNPFTNWDEWYHYDIANGYNTCELVDRLAPTSEAFTDEQNHEIIQEAYDRMIDLGAFDKSGNFVKYKKIYKE